MENKQKEQYPNQNYNPFKGQINDQIPENTENEDLEQELPINDNNKQQQNFQIPTKKVKVNLAVDTGLKVYRNSSVGLSLDANTQRDLNTGGPINTDSPLEPLNLNVVKSQSSILKRREQRPSLNVRQVDFFEQPISPKKNKDTPKLNSISRKESMVDYGNEDDDGNSNQSGKWTTEEHTKFLQGLKQYGKKWKKVQQVVGTRNCAQVRSHAQKFFVRMQKYDLDKNKYRLDDVSISQSDMMSSMNYGNVPSFGPNQMPQNIRFKQKGMSFDLSERHQYKRSQDIQNMLIQGLKPVELIDKADKDQSKKREKLKSQVFKREHIDPSGRQLEQDIIQHMNLLEPHDEKSSMRTSRKTKKSKQSKSPAYLRQSVQSKGDHLRILELDVYDYIEEIKQENGYKRRSRKASKVSKNMIESNNKDSDSILRNQVSMSSNNALINQVQEAAGSGHKYGASGDQDSRNSISQSQKQYWQQSNNLSKINYSQQKRSDRSIQEFQKLFAEQQHMTKSKVETKSNTWLRKRLLSEMECLPVVNHKSYKISKNDLVEPLIQLFLARKSEKFKGIFKAIRNGKIVNFIKDKQDSKYPSVCYSSQSENENPHFIDTAEINRLSPEFGKKFVKPQAKAMIKKNLMMKKPVPIIPVDDDSSSSSSGFSSVEDDNKKSKDEIQQQLFVSFYFDRSQNEEKKPEIAPPPAEKPENKVKIQDGKYNNSINIINYKETKNIKNTIPLRQSYGGKEIPKQAIQVIPQKLDIPKVEKVQKIEKVKIDDTQNGPNIKFTANKRKIMPPVPVKFLSPPISKPPAPVAPIIQPTAPIVQPPIVQPPIPKPQPPVPKPQPPLPRSQPPVSMPTIPVPQLHAHSPVSIPQPKPFPGPPIVQPIVHPRGPPYIMPVHRPMDISAQIAAAQTLSNNQNTHSFSRIEQSNSGNNLSIDMNNHASFIQLIRDQEQIQNLNSLSRQSIVPPQEQPQQITNLLKQIFTQQMATQQQQPLQTQQTQIQNFINNFKMEKSMSEEPKEQSIGKHFFDKESSNSSKDFMYKKKQGSMNKRFREEEDYNQFIEGSFLQTTRRKVHQNINENSLISRKLSPHNDSIGGNSDHIINPMEAMKSQQADIRAANEAQKQAALMMLQSQPNQQINLNNFIFNNVQMAPEMQLGLLNQQQAWGGSDTRNTVLQAAMNQIQRNPNQQPGVMMYNMNINSFNSNGTQDEIHLNKQQPNNFLGNHFPNQQTLLTMNSLQQQIHQLQQYLMHLESITSQNRALNEGNYMPPPGQYFQQRMNQYNPIQQQNTNNNTGSQQQLPQNYYHSNNIQK